MLGVNECSKFRMSARNFETSMVRQTQRLPRDVGYESHQNTDTMLPSMRVVPAITDDSLNSLIVTPDRSVLQASRHSAIDTHVESRHGSPSPSEMSDIDNDEIHDPQVNMVALRRRSSSVSSSGEDSHTLPNQNNATQLAMLTEVLLQIERRGVRPCMHEFCDGISPGWPAPPVCEACFEAMRPALRENPTATWLHNECDACRVRYESRFHAACDAISSFQERCEQVQFVQNAVNDGDNDKLSPHNKRCRGTVGQLDDSILDIEDAADSMHRLSSSSQAPCRNCVGSDACNSACMEMIHEVRANIQSLLTDVRQAADDIIHEDDVPTMHELDEYCKLDVLAQAGEEARSDHTYDVEIDALGANADRTACVFSRASSPMPMGGTHLSDSPSVLLDSPSPPRNSAFTAISSSVAAIGKSLSDAFGQSKPVESNNCFQFSISTRHALLRVD